MLNRYKKIGVITTGTDNVQLDTPEFEIVNINIDTVNRVLKVEIVHKVLQGVVTQDQSRTMEVAFSALPASVKVTGLEFLLAIETEILKLPQYSGAEKL